MLTSASVLSLLAGGPRSTSLDATFAALLARKSIAAKPPAPKGGPPLGAGAASVLGPAPLGVVAVGGPPAGLGPPLGAVPPPAVPWLAPSEGLLNLENSFLTR